MCWPTVYNRLSVYCIDPFKSRGPVSQRNNAKGPAVQCLSYLPGLVSIAHSCNRPTVSLLCSHILKSPLHRIFLFDVLLLSLCAFLRPKDSGILSLCTSASMISHDCTQCADLCLNNNKQLSLKYFYFLNSNSCCLNKNDWHLFVKKFEHFTCSCIWNVCMDTL